MKGARQRPASSRTRTSVGGAFNSPPNCWSTACGAIRGAVSAAAAARITTKAPNLLVISFASFRRSRIDNRQRGVRQERAGREKDRSGRGAAGDEVHVAGPQRV